MNKGLENRGLTRKYPGMYAIIWEYFRAPDSEWHGASAKTNTGFFTSDTRRTDDRSPQSVSRATSQPTAEQVLHSPDSDGVGTTTSCSSCICLCCSSNFDAANQPSDLDNSKTCHGKQSYSRSIKSSWYLKHPWINVCTGTVAYKVFCHVCCKAKALACLSFLRATMLRSWKAVIATGRKHSWFGQYEGRKTHQETMAKLAAKFSAVDVRSQLSK